MRRNVSSDVHRVVQQAQHVDGSVGLHDVQKLVPRAAAGSADVESEAGRQGRARAAVVRMRDQMVESLLNRGFVTEKLPQAETSRR